MPQPLRTEAPDGFVPAAVAAPALGFTREQVIRRIAVRQIPGEQIAGRWYVRADALHETPGPGAVAVVP